jgi:hypothetical protein
MGEYRIRSLTRKTRSLIPTGFFILVPTINVTFNVVKFSMIIDIDEVEGNTDWQT